MKCTQKQATLYLRKFYECVNSIRFSVQTSMPSLNREFYTLHSLLLELSRVGAPRERISWVLDQIYKTSQNIQTSAKGIESVLRFAQEKYLLPAINRQR